jgi:hypothetical protein
MINAGLINETLKELEKGFYLKTCLLRSYLNRIALEIFSFKKQFIRNNFETVENEKNSCLNETRRTRKSRGKIIGMYALIILCGLFICGPLVNEVPAYDNVYSHTDINRCSVSKFARDVSFDIFGKKYKKFRKYDFAKNYYEMEGYAVKASGTFEVEEWLQESNYQKWIEMGGYSADEPELYSSLRHFYDPLTIQTDKHTHQKVSYLTDHASDFLDKVNGTGIAIVDPLMDAREWALKGPARRGYPENRYSLRRGVEYMRRAWAEKNIKLKDKLFAAAWRSCGETMHLLSDMTVPAHVRNDAHPGYPAGKIFSGMRYDPYEYYVTKNHDKIKAWSKRKADRAVSGKIDASKDAFSLFHLVALYTNHNFFSADTLAGKNQNGQKVRSANGMLAYPSPNLDRCVLDPEGFYKDRKTGIHVAHADWADNTWWNTRNYLRETFLPSISNNFNAAYSYEDVVIDQAKLLIPVAVNANCKLLEMFIPEVKVKLKNWDEKKRVLTGSITHVLSGVYADRVLYPGRKPLLFNNAGDRGKSWSSLTLNDHRYSEVMDDYALTISNNQLKISLGEKIKLNNNGENLAQLKLFFGGFWVRSNDMKLSLSDSMRPPTASPPDTEFSDRIDVTLSSPDGGYIVYRINGGALAIYSAPITLTATDKIETYADKDPYNKNAVSSKVATFQYTKVNADRKTGRWVLTKVIPIDGCSFYKHECYTVNCSTGEGSWQVQKSASSCSNSVKAKSGSGAYSVPPAALIPGETIKLTTSASGSGGFGTSMGVCFYRASKRLTFTNRGRASCQPDWCQDIARANTSRRGSIPPEGNFTVPEDLNKGGLLLIEANGSGGSFETSMNHLYLYRWQE